LAPPSGETVTGYNTITAPGFDPGMLYNGKHFGRHDTAVLSYTSEKKQKTATRKGAAATLLSHRPGTVQPAV
jgi:hypothetical protein